jgi:hypothetical protein
LNSASGVVIATGCSILAVKAYRTLTTVRQILGFSDGCH